MSADTDDADHESIEAVVAAARPVESTGAVLARARIAGALFGPKASQATGLGRFRVLERLGGGGMGVVYAAYDSQLDRGVALKTVHVAERASEIALREAKALAKLAHPNIVPVFDVGLEAGSVYIVMELVRGTTLRHWIAGQSQRAILDAYRQAGEALAAAHAAGLVHRDFKPENAIVGADGRVRVVDFGLACEAESTAPVAGTPRYMAPEHRTGAPATAAADQFSFGRALGEALTADPARAVPRRLAELVERATARDLAARFPSMRALLQALGADTARRRRLALGIGAAVLASGAAFIAGRGGAPAVTPPACSGDAVALVAVWPPSDRAVTVERVAALSPYGATVARLLADRLAAHTASWTEGRVAACVAHRTGVQSAVLLDRRMACLERARTALGAVRSIAESARRDELPALARAVGELPDPATCADARALAADYEPAPPALAAPISAVGGLLVRARIYLAAGRLDTATALGAAAVELARSAAHRPLLAEALGVAGRVAMWTDPARAAVLLREATTLAYASGAIATGTEAWARRAWIDGVGAQPARALDGYDVVEALASHDGAPFARALLHNNAGSIELGRGRMDHARQLLVRARQEAADIHGPEAIELVAIRSNLALVTPDLAERDRMLREARDALARGVGADHPDVLVIEAMRIRSTVADRASARDQLVAVANRFALHPSLSAHAAALWADVAQLELELDRPAAARAALTRALDLGGGEVDDAPEAPGLAAMLDGDVPHARQLLAAELAALGSATAGEPWYVALARARVELARGHAELASDQPGRAEPYLARASATFAAIALDHHGSAFEQRRDHAAALLARSARATAARR